MIVLYALRGRPKLFRLDRGAGEDPKTFHYIDQTLLNIIRKDDKEGGGGQKLSILRRNSLWAAPYGTYNAMYVLGLLLLS